MKTRRVGTFTCGILLLVFGILLMLHMFYPSINYHLILRLWPLVLIFLGIEMIIANIRAGETALKYDGGAITLVFVLTLFSLGMGVAEFLVNQGMEYFY